MQSWSNIGFPDESIMARAATAGEPLRPALLRAESVPGQARDTAVKEAAREFEALFVAYLLKVMRETIEESELGGGSLGRGIYTELFDQEVARAVARRSPLGISDIILRDLSQDDEMPPASEAGDAEEITGGEARRGVPVPGHSASAVDAGEDVPDFRLPVQAPVSSVFGMRADPFNGRLRFHRGIDLAAPAGTVVCVPLGGRVVYAGYENGYGNTVIIEHDGELRTRYAHLGMISVKTGETVRNGASIGSVGQTGRSTGPHLHFEVLRIGEVIDPADLMVE